MKSVSSVLFCVLLASASCIDGSSPSNWENARTYYDNGKVESEGMTQDGLKQDEWREWYSDGTIRWRGHYVNDTLVERSFGEAELEVSLVGDTSLVVGRATPVRVRVGDIHPSRFTVMITKGTINKSGAQDPHDYVIHPEKAGNLRFIVQWTNSTNGLIEVLGEKQFVVRD